MKVALDVTPAVLQNAGMGRYAEELARALVEVASGNLDLRLFYADRDDRIPSSPLDTLPRSVLRSSTKPWRLRVLLSSAAHQPMDALFGDADLFHASDHLLPPLQRMRSVFTLHDLAFLKYPQTHLAGNRWFLRLMMPRFLRQADAVICVSHQTKQDAMAYYHLDERKVHVIPEGVAARFQPQDPRRLADVRTHYGLPDRFILYVGTIEPRKNLVTLLSAYERLAAIDDCPQRLVLVGRRGWKTEPFILALARSPMRDRVLLVGRVRDADLPAIYAAADLFVYPSLYEGFGLPPLEAMASGTPVVAAASSAMTEVVGNAGLLVPPDSVDALAEAMRRVLEQDELRQVLAAKGLARAKQFSWTATARLTLEVYQAVHSIPSLST